MGKEVEMFARMFEAVVEHKIKSTGRESNYLSDINYIKGMMLLFGIPMTMFPYPVDEELEWMSGWVDRLIAEVKKQFGVGNFDFSGKRIDESSKIETTSKIVKPIETKASEDWENLLNLCEVMLAEDSSAEEWLNLMDLSTMMLNN
jgi:hypothetical protein